MAVTIQATLLGVFAVASSVWLGGYVAIAVVARVAARTLSPEGRVAFFRRLGRSYGMVAGAALLVALGTGAALLRDRAWDATLIAATGVAAALVAVTAAGVAQARRMTRLRHAVLQHPEDAALTAHVRKRARRASMLRGAIGLLSLTLIALGSLLAAT